MPASSWSASNRRSGPGPVPVRAGSRGGLRALSRPHDRRARAWWGDGTASISPCMARWACASVARPEADIARRVREVVGRDAFIAGTFDPHGNATPSSCVRLTSRSARNTSRTTTAVCRRARGPHADPRHARRLHTRQRHGEGADPDRDGAAMDWRPPDGPARPTWEAREPDLYMNVFFGFPFADVPDVGMTVQGNGQRQARACAQGCGRTSRPGHGDGARRC